MGSTQRPNIQRPGLAAFAGVAVVGVAVAGFSVQGGSPEPAAQQVAAQPAAGCRAQALPTLGGVGGDVVAASRTGVLAGLASDPSGTWRPVVWDASRVRQVPTQLESAVPAGVNDQGVVVGAGFDPGSGTAVGWAWTGHAMHRLDPGRGEAVMPEAISASGRIVGAVEVHEDEQAVVWRDFDSPAKVLAPLPGDQGAHAFAVATDGTVGGVSLGDGGAPVVWRPDGLPMRLESPAGFGMVLGFDASSRPVGVVYLADGESRAAAWDQDGRPANLGTLRRGGSSSAVASLGGGDIVGTAGGGPGATTRPQAILWRSQEEGRLLEPVDLPGFDGVAGSVNAVGRSGGQAVVAGHSEDRSGQRVPTLWRCP